MLIVLSTTGHENSLNSVWIRKYWLISSSVVNRKAILFRYVNVSNRNSYIKWNRYLFDLTKFYFYVNIGFFFYNNTAETKNNFIMSSHEDDMSNNWITLK